MSVAASPQTVRFTVLGRPVPLERSRTRNGKHYLPKRSAAYRKLIQSEWMVAGRPRLDGRLRLRAHFYGAHGLADTDNLLKALADALQGLAFENDRQLVRVEGERHKAGMDGPRAEIELEAVA
jgi:Holliday junction resolvase RusA-like endonuclease